MKASRLLFLGFVLYLARPAFAGRQVTIDDLMQYRNASAVELSADGSRAVFVVSRVGNCFSSPEYNATGSWAGRGSRCRRGR